MNSSLQCLSHTPILREYFTSKAYVNDINKTNPLGHKGQLAQLTAVLFNSLWKRYNNQVAPRVRKSVPGSYVMVNAPSLTPKTFKDALGKFNEHFQGNEQHDAQELLAFLLDGLSEDLNRVIEKPYIEQPDSDGRPDAELADIWWSNHLKRDFSIIVALFSGQYKSLLTCRTCKYESARFEPFSVLQLPLPEDEHLLVSLILYPTEENSSVMRYNLRVRNDGTLMDVLNALAKIVFNDRNTENVIGSETSMNDENGKEDSRYLDLAKRFVVADVRDSCIMKVAPTSWNLKDLQNKDSGELPLLQVYEIDDFESSEPTGSESRSSGLLAVAQRRSEIVSRDLLHPFSHRVFGTPFLLRLSDFRSITGRQLYDIVAKNLQKFVPIEVVRFLRKGSTVMGPDREDAESNRLSELSLIPRSERRGNPAFRTFTDDEDVSGGPTPRYGFRLRVVSRDCKRCVSCPWYECCIGCYVLDDDTPTMVKDSDTVTVDWHFSVDIASSGFGSRSTYSDSVTPISSTKSRKPGVIPIKNHPSCSRGIGSQDSSATTLEQCLDSFAEEEKIPEAYCSRCKDFRVQTKRMSLWRLPPVVIIQLKRFQFTQQMRRKLRELVVFPVEGLDLTRILAKEAQEMDSRNGHDEEDPKKLYDLYGVIHHQGALSGGHYMASLKSEFDGQWRFFNDAQVFEISSREVVDSSAYILFYMRRDMIGKGLSDFWKAREESTLSQEDIDELMRPSSERCVIS